MLVVTRIGQHLEQVLVTSRPAAVLGRTRPRAVDQLNCAGAFQRELARRIDDVLGRAEADGADSDLFDELRSSVAEVLAWDEPVASTPATPKAPTKEKPRRWFGRTR